MLKKASHIYVVLAVEILGMQQGVVTLREGNGESSMGNIFTGYTYSLLGLFSG